MLLCWYYKYLSYEIKATIDYLPVLISPSLSTKEAADKQTEVQDWIADQCFSYTESGGLYCSSCPVRRASKSKSFTRKSRHFISSPVVKTPCIQWRVCRFDSWSGNEDTMCRGAYLNLILENWKIKVATAVATWCVSNYMEKDNAHGSLKVCLCMEWPKESPIPPF